MRLIAITGVLVLVAACTGTPHAITSTAAGGESSSTASALSYAACMRSHGVPDFPDSAISVRDGDTTFNVPAGINMKRSSARQP